MRPQRLYRFSPSHRLQTHIIQAGCQVSVNPQSGENLWRCRHSKRSRDMGARNFTGFISFHEARIEEVNRLASSLFEIKGRMEFFKAQMEAEVADGEHSHRSGAV